MIGPQPYMSNAAYPAGIRGRPHENVGDAVIVSGSVLDEEVE